jgi:pimeloyl-ACP methyl ester carboxylesterase
MLKSITPVVLSLLSFAAVTGCDTDTPESVQEEILAEAEFRGHSQAFCEQVFTFEHMIELDDGAVLRLTEKFSTASVLRFPRRALLMMPGTLVSGDMYDIEAGDDPGSLNALERAAREGFYAYAVTYEGYPGSSQPADGSTVTPERALGHMGEVVQWIRHSRKVPRVDLLGTSFGSSLATALGGTMSPINRRHIGRLVLQALVYKEVTPLFQDVFFSPEVQAALENAPNGYIMTMPEMYGLILFGADQDAANWGFANFPDVYATGPTLAGFDLPVFEAVHGRAPALQFWGTLDLITPIEDAETFQTEYGGHAQLSVLDGAGHAPYIATDEVREDFWAESFDYLDYGPKIFLACAPN